MREGVPQVPHPRRRDRQREGCNLVARRLVVGPGFLAIATASAGCAYNPGAIVLPPGGLNGGRRSRDLQARTPQEAQSTRLESALDVAAIRAGLGGSGQAAWRYSCTSPPRTSTRSISRRHKGRYRPTSSKHTFPVDVLQSGQRRVHGEVRAATNGAERDLGSWGSIPHTDDSGEAKQTLHGVQVGGGRYRQWPKTRSPSRFCRYATTRPARPVEGAEPCRTEEV
jgi:hypothetical protein